MNRRAWTDRFGNDADVEAFADNRLLPKEPQKVANVKLTVKKRKKLETVPVVDAREEETPELVLEQPVSDAPLLQRPNAVRGRDGDPVLLFGLALPWPPSSNRYWKSFLMVRKGTRFPLLLASMREVYKFVQHMNAPSDEAKQYKERIRQLAMEKRFRFLSGRDLRMDILVCPPDRRGRDHHNYDKVLLDALQDAGVYEDDEQVKVLHTALGPIVPGGRVIVHLKEINHDPDALLREYWG